MQKKNQACFKISFSVSVHFLPIAVRIFEIFSKIKFNPGLSAELLSGLDWGAKLRRRLYRAWTPLFHSFFLTIFDNF